MSVGAQRAILAVAAALAAALILAVGAGVARADQSLAIRVSANPTAKIASTVTVTGSSEVVGSLYVFASAGQCAATPAQEVEFGATELSSPDGDPISAGSFSRAYQYKPADAGVYTVCAYVEDANDAQLATASVAFTAHLPTASVSIHVGGKPTQAMASTITVAGSSQVAAALYVYAVKDDVPCGTEPTAETALGSIVTRLSEAGGDAIGPGSFSKRYLYTPSKVGPFELCAYVDDAPNDPPFAVRAASPRAVAPAAFASVSVGQPDTALASTITVSGSSAVQRRLYVYVAAAGLKTRSSSSTGLPPCADVPKDETATTAVGFASHVIRLSGATGDRIQPGRFLKQYQYVLPSAGNYLVCAYVDDDLTDAPDMRRSKSFSYAGIGILPPRNIGSDCDTDGGQLPVGRSEEVAAIDACRAREGVGPLTLPSNWTRLTIPEQLLVVIDLERVNRGLAPVIGLSRTLNRFALGGAQRHADPTFPSQPAVLTANEKPAYTGGGSIWAGVNSTLLADYGWMYHDGYGTTGFVNIDCTGPNGAGCWGHRDNILSDDDIDPLVGGGATVPASDAFEQLYGYRTSDLVFRWSNELRYFANRPGVEPLRQVSGSGQ